MPQFDSAAIGLSYRRGTLFGFTLAEIVLLIIFALLLSVTALLVDRDGRIRDLEQKAKDSVSVTPDEAQLVEAIRRSFASQGKPVPKPDELFKELKLVKEAQEQAPLIEAIREAYRQLGRPVPKPDDLFKELKLLKDAALVKQLEDQLVDKERELAESKKHNLPPILEYKTSNFFRSGQAKLVPEFHDRLVSQIIPELAKLGRQYNVEVIEIVGHTDEQPVANAQSKLDSTLLPFLNGKAPDVELVAGDNAGLGLARAAAVAEVLSKAPELRNFRILPLSAGQVVNTDETISQGISPADVEARRRIEIRMRRRK